MKHYLSLLSISILAALLTLSCNSNVKRETNILALEYEKLDSTVLFTKSNFSVKSVTKLDTKENVLGWPLFLKQQNNNYYILDKQQNTITIFSENGEYINKISKVGKGPGEYIFIKDYLINDKNNIEILCNAPTKIIEYNISGSCIKETELDFNAVAFSNDVNGEYLFFRDRVGHPKYNNSVLLRADKELSAFEPLLDMPEFMLAGYPEMNLTQGSSNSILFKHTFDNNVYRLYPDTLITACSIDFGKK